MDLVLSLFPGVDLLGRAFAASGFSVVLGPDLLWDACIEDFHCPAGRFDGVMGGPPCTEYSDANRHRNPTEGDRLVREFLRVVAQAQPTWFLLENVRNVPSVQLAHYHVQRLDVTDAEFGGRQRRLRHIQFGHVEGFILRPVRTRQARSVTHVPALTTAPRSSADRHCRRCALQGFTALPLRALTPSARRRVIGNGVTWAVASALAAAVREASSIAINDCGCLCGREVRPRGRYATAACRQRMSRARRFGRRTVSYPGDRPGTLPLPGEISLAAS